MDLYELTRRVLGEPETDPDSLERVRRRVRQEIEAAQGLRKRHVWSRLLPIAAALGLGIVLIAVLVVPTGRRAAAVELRQLGRIASTQQPLDAGRGEYLLFRSEELRQEGFTFPDGVSITRITRLRSSIWLASDRSGFRRDEVVSSSFETEDDRRAWLAEGAPDLPLPGSHLFGPGEAALHDVTHLPSEPERMLSILRSGAIADRPPGDEQIFILIGELLAQGDATPEVRAALFEVAARLDGIELVGEVEDPLGRLGTAISVPTPQGRTRLVFDEDTAQLLAIEEYETDREGTERLSSWIAAQPTIIVDDAPPELVSAG